MKTKALKSAMKLFAAFILSSIMIMTYDICGSFAITTYAASETKEVSAPTASVKSGTHYMDSSYLEVSLKSKDSDAKIYYSRDGKKYYIYKSPVKIKETTTLRVYSSVDGNKSKVKKYKYTLTPKVEISAPEGRYTSPIALKIKTSVPDVDIYYTYDGSKPTKKSDVFPETGVMINKSCTFKILIVKDGWKSRIITNKYTVADPNKSLIDDVDSMYGYNQLGKNEKKIYKKVYEAIKEQKKVSLKNLKATESMVMDILTQIGHDTAHLNVSKYILDYEYDKNDYVISVKPDDYYCSSINEKYLKKLKKAAKPIVAKAVKQSDMKVRARIIHDELLKMTTYKLTYSTPDGPLLYGEALCEGYSKAFQYLCQSAGIECVNVSGTGAGQPHMWNMIKIDGAWFHVDSTFDDQKTISYEYFCVKDSFIQQDHTVSDEMMELTPVRFKVDEELFEEEYERFLDTIESNYKKGNTTTRFYTDASLVGRLLIKVTSSMQSDLWGRGIKKQPWYCYYNDWIEITLK